MAATVRRNGYFNLTAADRKLTHWGGQYSIGADTLGPDLVEGRSYLIDFETASKIDPNPLLLLGVYADEYKRIEGHWRISRTRLEMVWPQRSVGGGVPGNGMTLPERATT